MHIENQTNKQDTETNQDKDNPLRTGGNINTLSRLK